MRSSRRAAAVLLGLASATVFAACGGDEETAPEVRPCVTVGEELASDADATVDVTLDEYAFAPDTIEVAAGIVTFEARNIGNEDHELAFLPGGGDVPLTDEGVPDEDALEAAGAFELEGFGPDQSCAATYELAAGTYSLFCIVRADDGTTHLSKGMRGTLRVT